MNTISSVTLSKKVQERTFSFLSDPGHGWLSVPKRLLFNVCSDTEIKSISSYSYTNGKSVYLEEDCDAIVFIEAWKRKYGKFHYAFSATNNRSPIRSYDSLKSSDLLEEKYFI